MKIIRQIAPVAFAAGCLFASITVGRAEGVVYTNIKPRDTFVVGVGIGLIPFTGVYNLAGVGFKARQDYIFDGMELAVNLESGPNLLDVYLMSDLNGLPDQVLETFTLVNRMSSNPQTGVVKIRSVVHPMLFAGQEYWVVAGGGPSTFATWQENVHGVMGPNVSGPSLNSLVRDANTNIVEAVAVIGRTVPGP